MFRLIAKFENAGGTVLGYRFANSKGECRDLSVQEAINLVKKSETTAKIVGKFELAPIDFSKDRLPVFRENGTGVGRRTIFIDSIIETTKGREFLCISAFGEKKVLTRVGVVNLIGAGRIVNAKITSGNVISGILMPIPIIDKKTDKKDKPINNTTNGTGQMSLLGKQQDVKATTSKPLDSSGRGSKKVMNDYNVQLSRMKELVPYLQECARVYEQENRELISNKEYDKLYDELVLLEDRTGVILAGSVTQKAGFEVLSKLPKVKHPSKMLSLDKTKDRNALANTLNGKRGFLGWKLDGITVVATYEKGLLVSAVTRGNGEIGEDITSNYKTFINVPLVISNLERVVIRGEAIISYSDFEKINEKLVGDDKYKNPRNLTSGSVRQLDSKITSGRNVRFVAFGVVEGFNNNANKSEKLNELHRQGFEIVDFKLVDANNIVSIVEEFEKEVESYQYPTDGLVLSIDDIDYSKSLGATSKHPKDSIAFKWGDEVAETTLLDIEWSTSRTGLINPIAIFEPVDLEGTTVERASVHNISIMEDLKLGIGDKITVYKANMIIPQVDENFTKSSTCVIPNECTVCGGKTSIIETTSKKDGIERTVKVLKCNNLSCSAQLVRFLSHFVSRDAMNIDGLSESTLEKFVDSGIISHAGDIFRLDDYESKITSMGGFGQRSYDKLVDAIENACEDVDMAKFVYALGIPNVGKSTARDLVRHFDYDLNELMEAEYDDLTTIDGVGQIVADDIIQYFGNSKNIEIIEDILDYIEFTEPEEVDENSSIAGMTFVVTGKVYVFNNRKEVESKIESLGGKLSGSVSKNTDYLINNDVTSTSGKNKKAKELGVPIISEQDFIDML